MAAVIAAPTPPAALRTEAAANWAEPANVVADITTEASPPIPAAWATSPNDAPKTTTAGAIVAARFAPALYGLCDPVTREIEPESEPRVASIPAEATLDRGVPCLPAVEARVLRARPRVEHEPRVAADEHHHVRGRVGPDSGEREERRRHLVVGQVVGIGIRELLQIDLAGGDRIGEGAEVGAAIPASCDVAVEGLGRGGHCRGGGERVAERAFGRGPDRRFAEVLDDRVHHPHGAAPRGVRRADRLD